MIMQDGKTKMDAIDQRTSSEKVKDNPLLTKQEFKELVEDYLLDFNDSHVYFCLGKFN